MIDSWGFRERTKYGNSLPLMYVLFRGVRLYSSIHKMNEVQTVGRVEPMMWCGKLQRSNRKTFGNISVKFLS